MMSWLLKTGPKEPCSLCLGLVEHPFLEHGLHIVSKPQPTDDTHLPAVKIFLKVEPLAPAELSQLMSKDQLPPPSSTHIAYAYS